MAELTALPKSVVETVLGRDLTEDEKVFVTSLEDAGLMDAPVAEPEPTERELIMAAPDCEHIVVKPKEDNPFGYARGHTYRSKSLGKEVALTYDWAGSRSGRWRTWWTICWRTRQTWATLRPATSHG